MGGSETGRPSGRKEVSMETLLLFSAAVLSLPGGLFAAYLVGVPRARWLSLLGGIAGSALVAVGIHVYLRSSHVILDAVSFWFGAFFVCSVGIFAGALIA